MITKLEALAFAIDQLDNDTPVSNADYTCYHYGLCEIKELLNYVYEEGLDMVRELDKTIPTSTLLPTE